MNESSPRLVLDQIALMRAIVIEIERQRIEQQLPGRVVAAATDDMLRGVEIIIQAASDHYVT